MIARAVALYLQIPVRGFLLRSIGTPDCMDKFPSFASFLFTIATASAQATHIVGPGGFADIAAALLASSPGDVVLVHPGSYAPFSLNIGVTIRAITVGTVAIVAGWGSVANVPAGQTAHFVGLDMNFIGVVGGRATFDQCSMVGVTTGLGGGIWVTNAEVHLQRCTVRALPVSLVMPPAPCQAQNAELTAIDCTIEGADAGLFFGLPGPAMQLTGSRLRGSSLTVRGGRGGSHASAVALIADAASTVWIADSALASPSASCPVQANSGRFARCTLMPNCGGLPAGTVLGMSRPQPLQNGAPFVLEFRDAPNQLVGVWVSLDLQTSLFVGMEQTVLLAPRAWAAGLFVTDATGFAAGVWPIPAGPQFIDHTLWFQAFGAGSLPLQASAVAGGAVR